MASMKDKASKFKMSGAYGGKKEKKVITTKGENVSDLSNVTVTAKKGRYAKLKEKATKSGKARHYRKANRAYDRAMKKYGKKS